MPRRDPSPPVVRRVPWQRVVLEVCGRKVAYFVPGDARDARRRLAADRWLRVYPCPFHEPGRPHWHVGHVPSQRTVARIAAAIRARAQDEGRAA